MGTLHFVMIGKIWRDFGKQFQVIASKNSSVTGFGSVDTGVTIWEIEDTILGIK